MTLRFRIGDIPIEIHPLFWVATLVLAHERLLQPLHLLSWIVVVSASILLHEMGHALVLRRLGLRPGVELGATGGVTWAASRTGLAPLADILVSIAGPLAGLTLGVPLTVLGWLIPGLYSVPVFGVFYADIVFVNVAWGLLNLLPILPLDGGHVLRAWLRRSWPSIATVRSLQVSAAVAAIVAIIALVLGESFLAVGAGALAAYNLNAARSAK